MLDVKLYYEEILLILGYLKKTPDSTLRLEGKSVKFAVALHSVIEKAVSATRQLASYPAPSDEGDYLLYFLALRSLPMLINQLLINGYEHVITSERYAEELSALEADPYPNINNAEYTNYVGKLSYGDNLAELLKLFLEAKDTIADVTL